MATTHKPVHVTAAEEVIAKVKKSVRDRLILTPKGSYSIISDETSWIVRITPKVLEASKKRLTEEQLDAADLHGGSKPLHRPHHLGAALAVASMEDGEAKQAKESELQGGGLEEVVRVVEVGAKPPKAAAAKAEAKS